MTTCTTGTPRALLTITFCRSQWVEPNAKRLILHVLMSIGVIVGFRLSRSYILNSASITKRNDTTPRPTYAMKHGGMCPVKGCLLTKKVREAWLHDSAAADQAEAEDSGNDWTVIDFGAAPTNFTMMTRDPQFDRYISGTLRSKREHDPHVA